jgi:pantoate--beta-alanine ligase
MGYLHEGHLSLVERARQILGRRAKVVVSIYVNPTQFGPKEDFTHYPRDLKRDLKLCRAAGVDAVLTPTDQQMYPGKAEGRYSTYVVEESLSQDMEGASRPGHFRGVTTVVAKLFNIVLPDVAVFGAKDFQQAAVIRRMVSNLNFPVKIVVAPTLRERDGLALSSRNKYLSSQERPQAQVLSLMIRRARELIAQERAIRVRRLRVELLKLLARFPAARLDYLALFDPGTLEPVSEAKRGTHLALAVFVGRTRLIDNAAI